MGCQGISWSVGQLKKEGTPRGDLKASVAAGRHSLPDELNYKQRTKVYLLLVTQNRFLEKVTSSY